MIATMLLFKSVVVMKMRDAAAILLSKSTSVFLQNSTVLSGDGNKQIPVSGELLVDYCP